MPENEFRPDERALAEVNPSFAAAREKAEDAVDRARLNEAVRVIDDLLIETQSMPIAQRFSTTKKVKDSDIEIPGLVINYGEMTIAEYKRRELQDHLRKIKSDILESVAHLRDIVMDIEATKLD